MHLGNNLTSSFLAHYDHLLGSDPQTSAYEPTDGHRVVYVAQRQNLDSPAP